MLNPHHHKKKIELGCYMKIIFKRNKISHVWWDMPAIPPLKRW
jgi:hypothetical protein